MSSPVTCQSYFLTFQQFFKCYMIYCFLDKQVYKQRSAKLFFTEHQLINEKLITYWVAFDMQLRQIISQWCPLTAVARRSSVFPRSWASSELLTYKWPVLWTLDHTYSITCCYLPGFTPVLVLPTAAGWPGWVGLGGWLNTERMQKRFELVKVTHSSTNQARRRTTALIEINVLPQHHTTMLCIYELAKWQLSRRLLVFHVRTDLASRRRLQVS